MMPLVSTTGHIYTVTHLPAAQPEQPPAPYTFPASISSLAVTKLITATLALLEDGSIHSLVPVKHHSPLLQSSIKAWNDSEERRSHNVVDVVLGTNQSIGVIVTEEGTLFSFGSNEHGERGVGHNRDYQSMPLVTPIPKFLPTDTPPSLPDAATSALNVRIVSVSVGAAHVLALSDSGDVYGWGRNIEGQLFTDPTASATIIPSPVYIQWHRQRIVREVKCCQNYSVVLDNDGQLWYGGYGLVKHSIPYQPLLLSFHSSTSTEPVLTFDVGHSHLIALTITNCVFSIGMGLFGQLGLGNNSKAAIKTTALTQVRVSVPLTVPIVKVVCGAQTTFLIDGKGGVYVCGSNQHGKLTSSIDQAHIHAPMPLSLLAGLTVSDVGASDSSTSYFVSTRINNISPEFLSCDGDTELTIGGIGFFPHSSPMTVKFTVNGQCAIVDAVYDMLRDRIKCVSPPLSIDITNSRTPCRVSVSLDSQHYSDSECAYVYAPPPVDEASLKPQCVPMTGNHQCVLAVPLLPLPYHAVVVRLQSNHSDWQCDVNADYDSDRQCLTFPSPAITDAQSSYIDAALSLSFNQQQFYPLSQTLSFYQLSHYDSQVLTVSLIPTAYHFNVRGCHHHQRLTVKFIANGRDFSATARATFTSSKMLRQQLRQQREQAYQTLLVKRASNDTIRTKLAKPEDEKDDDDRKRDEDDRINRETQIESENKNYSDFIAQLDSDDQSLRDLSEKEQNGYGRIECVSPSLLAVGPCQLSVFVSLNDQDYQDTGLTVRAEAPTLSSLVPDCGPMTGDTSVKVTGEGFYQCQSIITNLTTLTLPSLPAADPVDDKLSAKSGKKGSVSVNSKNSLSASPRPGSSSARRISGASPLLAPTSASNDVVLSPSPVSASTLAPTSVTTSQPATYTAASNASGNACIQYTTVAHSVGEEQVLLAFQFDDQSSLVLGSPSLTFTYYSQPTFTEASPAAVSVYGNTEVALLGKGIFPSSHVAVRLTLREPDDDKKSKDKEAKTARKDKSKLTEEEKSKLEEDDRAREREEAERRVNAPFVVVKALIKGMDEEEESPVVAKSPKTSAGGKKKTKDDVIQPSVTFTVPHAALLRMGGIADDAELEPSFVESMLGRSLDVSVAMNGQQFASTGLTVKYEQIKGKKSALAKKK